MQLEPNRPNYNRVGWFGWHFNKKKKIRASIKRGLKLAWEAGAHSLLCFSNSLEAIDPILGQLPRCHRFEAILWGIHQPLHRRIVLGECRLGMFLEKGIVMRTFKLEVEEVHPMW